MRLQKRPDVWLEGVLLPLAFDCYATAASLEVGLIVALLYADDAYIASTSRDILQDSMDILTDLFDRVPSWPSHEHREDESHDLRE